MVIIHKSTPNFGSRLCSKYHRGKNGRRSDTPDKQKPLKVIRPGGSAQYFHKYRKEKLYGARYWIPTMQAFARIYWPNQTATANTTTQYNFPSGADSIANGVQKPCLRRLSLSPNLVFLPIRRETHGCQLPRSSCRQQISQSHWPRCLRIVGLKYSRQKNGKNVEFIARWDWEERIKPRHSQALDCPR